MSFIKNIKNSNIASFVKQNWFKLIIAFAVVLIAISISKISSDGVRISIDGSVDVDLCSQGRPQSLNLFNRTIYFTLCD